MKTRILIVLFIILPAALFFTGYVGDEILQIHHYHHSIPVYGNSWVVGDPGQNRQVIRQEGIKDWNEASVKIRTYFKTENAGELNIGLVAGSNSGLSSISVTLGSEKKKVEIQNALADTLHLGIFRIEYPGYQWIELEGLEKEGDSFAEIKAILVGGTAASGKFYFVRDDFYWGRRGPSVHLGFQVPETPGSINWFYSEITVPEGEDVIGSYFMANGFSYGYFGIQVNSPAERRVLFSVWSPYQTDNPEEIPVDDRIILLAKGKDVYTGEFGNEGSGGQSYLRYHWKAGNTYRFLLKGEPSVKGCSDFTAWFYAPEDDIWHLIAAFRRPKTNSWLTGLYSFLENFIMDTGDQARMAYYGNQWVYYNDTGWKELTRIRFTSDATARKESRMDYAGGTEGSAFYLKNCGFFNSNIPIGTFFERKPTGHPPLVDFGKLPQ
jgi:hypothetical protein